MLLVDGEIDLHALDVLLDPALLVRLLDVHVLDADGAAVGVAQHVEDRVELHPGAPGDAAGEELAVEVPDGEAVGGGVELGVEVGLLGAERVEVGDEVAADAVGVDERLHLHLLVEHGLDAVDRVGVARPLDGLVGHAEGVEDLLVEAVLAHEELVDALEEHARLGALDDAVVVGRGDGHHLRQAEVGESRGVGAGVGGGVVERADADDEALARHEAGHRLHGADGARVGERHGDAGEVVGGQLVGADLADELLVGGEEAGEVEGVGVLDARHEQRAAAVALLDVDGEAEAEVLVADDVGLAVGALGVGGVHHRGGVGDGLHDGVADDVGEADLPGAGAAQVAVDDLAVDLEQLGRDLAERGRRRHREARLHVGDDAGGGAAQRRAGRLGRGRREPRVPAAQVQPGAPLRGQAPERRSGRPGASRWGGSPGRSRASSR